MQTLIVDGYNVIYAIPEIEELLGESLEAARTAIIKLFTDFKNSRKDIERIYIVFDGKAQDIDEEIPVGSGVTAIYTRGAKTADSKILEIIKNSQKPSLITVVSDDNFLYNNARIHGAYIKTVKDFCRMVKL